MDYNLAKQLKDAGFPQEPLNCEHFVDDNDEFIRNPTLPELIEACGDEFISLQRDYFMGRVEVWLANYDNESGNNCWTEGKTPEESIAKLWLKLNKK